MEKSVAIDQYIDAYSGRVKTQLELIRTIIQKSAPEAVEKISYGMPTFYLNGNLVHFAANKEHLGFYPSPSAIHKFKSDLKNYKTSKGAIQIPYNEELPIQLIESIVKFRVGENINKAKK